MSAMTDIQIASRQDGELGIVDLDGEVRLELAQRLLEAGENLLGEDDVKHLVLDLGGVTFMDSASLGVVIRLERDLRERGGRIVLCDVPPQVRRLLDVTGLADHFEQAADLADARAQL